VPNQPNILKTLLELTGNLLVFKSFKLLHVVLWNFGSSTVPLRPERVVGLWLAGLACCF
jgi:hypothetical protein